MSTFVLHRLVAPELHWRAMYERLASHRADVERAGTGIWGIWFGQFGIPANELWVVTHPLAGDDPPSTQLADFAGGELIEAQHWVPTVRPVTVQPVREPGLYVFRYFDVDAANIDEIAALSAAAWESFEHADGYSARPVGLFRPAGEVQGRVRMLLLTWYDGFESWSASRQPPPHARENFARRHALTHATVAYATRLADARP